MDKGANPRKPDTRKQEDKKTRKQEKTKKSNALSCFHVFTSFAGCPRFTGWLRALVVQLSGFAGFLVSIRLRLLNLKVVRLSGFPVRLCTFHALLPSELGRNHRLTQQRYGDRSHTN